MGNGGSLRIRNVYSSHFLNEPEEGSVAAVLDRTNHVGDSWALVDQTCPESLPGGNCYILVNENSNAALSTEALIFGRLGQKCYFSPATQEPLACPVWIIK